MRIPSRSTRSCPVWLHLQFYKFDYANDQAHLRLAHEAHLYLFNYSQVAGCTIPHMKPKEITQFPVYSWRGKSSEDLSLHIFTLQPYLYYCCLPLHLILCHLARACLLLCCCYSPFHPQLSSSEFFSLNHFSRACFSLGRVLVRSWLFFSKIVAP